MNKRRDISSASFLVTENCNLGCKYCFELGKHNKKAMTKEVAKNGLEFLCNGALKNNDKEFHVMLFGGEPLLAPHIIKYIFDYGLQLAKKHKIKFTASIVTNATLMNEDIFWLLMEYKDKVHLNCQLSVDGIQKVHDMYRVTKDGKGSFSLIEKNIPMFKKIYQNNPDMLSIHGCLNRYSLPYLFDSYKYFREEWGVSRIWFMPVHEEEWIEDDIEIYKNELNKIADYVLDIALRQNSVEEIRNYNPLNRCLDKRTIFPSAPCGAGKTFGSITASGQIYPCHHFYFNDPDKELLLGNVFDGIDDSKRKIFLDYSSDDMSCSSTCDWYGCHRCIAVNYIENGSILSQVRGNYCKMSYVEKKVVDRIKQTLIKHKLFEEQNIRNINYKEMELLDSWLDGNVFYEKYMDNKGKKHIYKIELTEDELNKYRGQVDKHYQEHGLEIIAKAIQLLLLKVDDLENKINDLGGM